MKQRKSKAKKFMVFISIVLVLALLGIVALFSVNAYVKNTTKDLIITSEEASKLDDVSCIIVLGCQVWDDGTPSGMLSDRLDRGIELYKLGVSPKIIMSGDHGRTDYDEVNAMKQYAIDAGVPSEDVFMDHAGFSTYETMYRAKEIFGAQNVVIVTQEYHLYRSIYIAEKLGLKAYGVSSDIHTYSGQNVRECREILARFKDFMTTLFKPEPTFLGEAIPVSGNGNVTNDKDLDEV